ncbi:MAG: D-2-hydroxyacid dehydrogenase [Desulfobacteraceae bacterium]
MKSFQIMDPHNKLLILTETPERFAALIKTRGFDDLECMVCHTTEEALLHVQDCTIILGEPKRIAPLLNGAKNLKWVQSTYAGTEPLMSPGMRTDYLLTNIRGIFGPLMSEYVFAHILALERHLFQVRENQKERYWQEIPYRSLEGTCLGICGVGSIGRHIAGTAKHFKMEVWGFKRTKEGVPGVDRIFTGEEFKEFLAHPEYVVITLPETPHTRHLFDHEAFGCMHPSAVLINVGRGPIVSERALIHALKKNQIRGAVLDVFEEEPLPKESPLWELPTLLITPHNAAISFPQPVVEIFVENYRRFKAGEPLQNRVDFKRGY